MNHLEKKYGSLIALGLTDDCADEIVMAYALYLRCVESNFKPSGKTAMNDRLSEIEKLSKKLAKELKKLTDIERQVINGTGQTMGTNDLLMQIGLLEIACKVAKTRMPKFSKKRPFLVDFGRDIRCILERHGHRAKVTSGNIFFKVIDTLFEYQEDEKSRNLLRQISKKTA